jgi:hypothetical protein
MPFNFTVPKKPQPLVKTINNKRRTGKTLIVPPKNDDFEEMAKSVVKMPLGPSGEDKFDQLASHAIKPVYASHSSSRVEPASNGTLSHSEINPGGASRQLMVPKRPSQLQVQSRATSGAGRSQVQQSLVSIKNQQVSKTCLNLQSYGEVSALIDEHLIKRQNLETIQSGLQGNRDLSALFYAKMTSAADRVATNRDFTTFSYNSGVNGLRIRTEDLLSLLERVNDRAALGDLQEAINGTKVENQLKIAILPVLIQKGVKIEGCLIDIDENLFEMMYHKIVDLLDNREQLQILSDELDQMLFTIYTQNYNCSTAKIIDNIGNQIAFPNPVYKRQGSVNYLSTSSAETKYYRDYITVVFATFLLLDCTEFIGIHLAMERNVNLINTLIRELSNQNIRLVLKRIEPDFVDLIYQKTVEMLFFKGWAEYSQISQIIHDVIFCDKSIKTESKALFYTEAVKRIHGTKYQKNLRDAFYLLTKSVDGQLLTAVRDRLAHHPVYDLFDKMIVQQLEQTKTHNRQNVFVCLLIREQTVPLLESSSKINLDPDDANSIINLVHLSQALSREKTLSITEGGKIRPLIKQNAGTDSVALVTYNQATNTTIYRICQ